MKKYYLEVYTRPTCSDCQDLKKFLQNYRIPHKEFDLVKQPSKEKDLIKITGNRIVPALIFSSPSRFGVRRKSVSFVGFERNKDEIKQLLNLDSK
ncbi:glutaredoxin family protein [Ornithinibacillus scapharcae]|uniref:glutaredoxin family protein n=1 Tax=Ornithinibacillus scapharcae TaxID=1147159 RepID=UPI000225B0BC|nr:glutaredoxin family protein [Ornithinibacillus scapharcae]